MAMRGMLAEDTDTVGQNIGKQIAHRPLIVNVGCLLFLYCT